MTSPTNTIFLNAQQSLLQRLYNQAPTSAIQNGVAQVGIAVVFSNNSPQSREIYANAEGNLVNSSGTAVEGLFFGGPGQTFVGGKAYIALSGQLDWKTANAFQNSSGEYDEGLFSFANALFYQVNLDSFEFTFSNSPFDAANLTSVNWFSIPMRMWVPGNTTSGNQSGFQASPNQQNWVSALQGLVPNGSNVFNDAAGNFLIAASPTTTPFSNQSFAWQFLPALNSTEFTVAENLNYYPNQIVQFGQNTGGILPDPLKTNTNYYVLSYNNSTGVLQVSDSLGGAPIQYTTTGSNAPGLTVTITTPDYPTEVYGSFQTYVNDFISWLPALPTGNSISSESPYSISGYFNGAPSNDAGQQIWHNGGFYNYQIYYDSAKENIVLIPGTQITNAGVSQVQGILAISVTNLTNSIIATNGTYSVYASLSDYANNNPYNYTTQFPSGTTPAAPTSSTTINTGSNNQWGPVFANLATGFVAGYWRQTNSAQNTALFNNSNFWSFFNADGTPKAFSNTSAGFFDPYSKLFANNSNSYGGNYTDNLEKSLGLGAPLLTVGEASTDNAIYVSLLDINNLPTGTTPPSTDISTSFGNFTWNGYQTPIQPAPSELPTTSFASPPAANNFSSFGVTVDFSGQMISLNSAEIKFVSLQSSDGRFTGTAETFQGWGNYQYIPGQQTPSYNQASQPNGVFNLVNFPLPNQAGTTGYVLKFLDQDQKPLYETKFFLTGDGNYYNVTVGSGSGQQIQQRYFPLAQSTTAAANNLAASVPYTQSALTSSDFGTSPTTPSNPSMVYGNYLNALTLTPIASSAPQLPPQLWDYNSSVLSNNPNLSQPWGPIVWTQNSTSYVLPSDYSTTPPGPANYTLSTALTSGDLTFSWLGGPNTLGGVYTLPSAFISNLSGTNNKTFALASGNIQFVNAPNGITPLPFQADIDGQWAVKTNPSTPLPNGTYTINFTQALTDTQGNSLPVGYAGNLSSSYSTTFTVNQTTNLQFQASSPGLTLITPSGSTASGQWLNITIDSWQKSDNSTFVLYATNAAGELISRDQTKVGDSVTFTEATLAKIGVVVTDNGTLIQEGQASVYLRTGQFLRLAVLAGDGTVIEDLPVDNKVVADGEEHIALLSNEEFILQGKLTHTLSPANWLATAQLQQDQPIYFFQANSTINIQASGSCALTNTLKWVPVEFDPLTGQKQVGGVLAADTDEFRDVLKQNALHFTLTGGGTGDKFDIMKDLTISTAGYYAPFLETSQGNTFFIGSNGNPGNQTHFRLFGDGVFGIEDLPGSSTSDFDFNDMVVRLSSV